MAVRFAAFSQGTASGGGGVTPVVTDISAATQATLLNNGDPLEPLNAFVNTWSLIRVDVGVLSFLNFSLDVTIPVLYALTETITFQLPFLTIAVPAWSAGGRAAGPTDLGGLKVDVDPTGLVLIQTPDNSMWPQNPGSASFLGQVWCVRV